VGATQVAGLAIHHRIFELEIDLPEATPCDPACAVYLGETEPINVWRDPERWQKERQRQFIGSEPFWQLLATLFQASWASKPRSVASSQFKDLWQLTKAVRPNVSTPPYTFLTVGMLWGMDWE